MAKLTNAELEMLGLTSNNERAANESTIATIATIAYDEGVIAAKERANKLREQYVGRFVRANKRGKTYIGMCDDVHVTANNKVYLGMVAANPNEWVGMLVDPNETWLCVTDLEREMARASARMYFDFEIESLKWTIARERANGKSVSELTNRLANMIDWRSKL